MIRKESVVCNNVVKLIQSYREFLNLNGEENESDILKVVLSRSDVDCKSDNPDVDPSLIELITKLEIKDWKN